MTYMSREEKVSKVKNLLKILVDKGLSYNQIQNMLDNRINSRTLYRWALGEVAPQRDSDIRALEKLVKDIT